MRQLKAEGRLLLRGIGELHRLSPYNLPAKCVRSLCNALQPFVNLYLSAAIVDALAAGKRGKGLVVLVLLTLGCNLFLILVSKQMDAVNYRKWHAFYLRYNLAVGEKAQTLPYEKVEDYRTYVQIKNLDDAMKIGNYGLIKLHSRIPLLVENFIKVCCCLGLLFSVVRQKAAAPGGGVPGFVNSIPGDIGMIGLVVLCALVCVAANRRIAASSYGHLGRLSKRNRMFDYYTEHYLDSHRAGKDIRLYCQDRLITAEIEAAGQETGDIVEDMNKDIFRNNFLILLADVLLFFYTYLYVGVKSVLEVFAVGGVVKYCGGVLQFARAFSDMMDAFSQLRSNSRYLADYFAYMDLPEAAAGTGTKLPDRIVDRLEVSHVSFRYPGTEAYVLKDVSFTIRAGERIAVVGCNGSGKTTMIKLLCRLYEPTEGVIRYNGVDIRAYDREAYLALLGVVFQDFKLFSFTLGQNVAAKMVYDRARVEDCLGRVGLGERLKGLLRGTDTYLYKDFEEEGVEVSGGEAQKIALARALYKEAPVIILDEPTAALDPVAEVEIYSHFKEIVEDKTAIFISHRLSSCCFCDRILVFSDGMVAQQGSHEELLGEEGGCYASLWHAQAQYYT